MKRKVGRLRPFALDHGKPYLASQVCCGIVHSHLICTISALLELSISFWMNYEAGAHRPSICWGKIRSSFDRSEPINLASSPESVLLGPTWRGE